MQPSVEARRRPPPIPHRRRRGVRPEQRPAPRASAPAAHRAARPRATSVLCAASAILGVAIAVVLARDGSLGWQLARAAVTVAVIAVAAAGIWRWPWPAARFIAAGSPSTVVRWDVPETGHTQALRTHPGEWERRVVAFLTEALHVVEP